MERLVPTLLLGLLLSCASFADKTSDDAKAFLKKVVASALEQTKEDVTYDGSYTKIAYPGGDVPANKGVCTDVIIRAYRKNGFDLQKLVHEDMKANFGLYPKIWGQKKTDTNIDHRRVPNLRVFFKRKGEILELTKEASDFKPGELVTWNVGGSGKNLPHIGIVSDKKTPDGKRPLIIHNIGAGPQAEDMLFNFPLTGHFRFVPKA